MTLNNKDTHIKPTTTISNAGKTWTNQQDDELIQWLKSGAGLGHIASMMGRSQGAIIARMEHINNTRCRFVELRIRIEKLL